MSVTQLIRPDLLGLTGYSTGIDNPNYIRLNANESPWDPLVDYKWQLNRYPQKYNQVLQQVLSNRYNVQDEQMVLTRGSDDGIDAITRLFITPYKDEVIICPPTFVMYSISARIQGGGIIECPLKASDFSLDEAAIEAAINRKNSKLMYICRPNNPTGNTVTLDSIGSICHQATDKVMVVVDEAYIEFSPQQSASLLLEQFDNLIVLRTLSKAYGLAGLRLGIVLAHSEVIKHLEAILPPFPFPTPVVDLARKVCERPERLKEQVEYLCQQRQWLSSQLALIPMIKKVWPSEANFVLVTVEDSQLLVEFLEQHGILVRTISPTLVRIGVGLDEQNRKLIKLLKRYR